MPAFEELRFPSADKSLQLYARHYRGDGPTIIMMHGLTRNSADFDGLAQRLAGRFNLLVPDQRGRGQSDWDDDPADYIPTTYCNDMLEMIDRFQIDRPFLIGTSMGGLMAMIMATIRPRALRGMVLNDVGPVVEKAGLDRIASYVGAATTISSWKDAADYCRRTNGYAFPHYTETQWDAFARRLFVENADGIPELAYDPAIAAGLSSANPSAVPPDLWQIWRLLVEIPTLVVRGGLSDILSADTVEKMSAIHPAMRSVTVPGVGHAPMLDEPEAVEAIEQFLTQFSDETARA